MSCKEYEALIERLLSDEIGDAGRDRLLAHAETCAACREFVDLHYNLLGPDGDVELPGDAAFDGMRRAVLREVHGQRGRLGESLGRWLAAPFRTLLERPALAGGLALSGMLAMLAAGVLVGREWGSTVLQPAGFAPVLESAARDNRVLSDTENSPFVFSNVAFDNRADGRLELSFDVTQHMRLVRPGDDPLVREVLVQSLLNPSSVATRLAALDQARNRLDTKVSEALIITMLNDPNQAVRLRALEILAQRPDDPTTQAAFMAVLRGEESVQMRLLALDFLARGPATAGRLDELLADLSPEDDRAVLIRAADYRPLGAGRGGRERGR